MNDIYSFYQLISKYQIEIPIIQRDYAQGRNNSKAADVRKSLVDNMIKAVKEDKPLFFDFVYGRVDNNKFIPFDGQQRLTTLFLFHKYVFEKCQSDSDCNHKDNCSCGGILGRFSYATRQSSREFCEKLVQEKIISGNSLTDNIKNQSWFYPDWEKDPTVMGMLTMLDEIHCQMRDETDFKTFAEKLTSGCNCPITFHFVDMGEHKMSDETYVKMNARGKTLTPFENFKASLEQYLEGKKMQNLLDRLKNKIDGDWLDLFWKINGNVLPDTLMMSFFNRHFMNVWRSWYANNSKSEKKDEYDAFNTRIQKEMPLYPTKDDFVSFDIYEYVIDNCGVEDCLSPIFNIWDALCEKDNSILSYCQAVWNRKEEEPKWNLYFGDKNKDNRETYPSRVAFYALMKYFTNSTDTRSLTQWMRVVWNIIENSTIDSSDTYHAALRLIEKLSTKSHTIYNALANEFESFELGNQYHAQEQVAEERAKAKQIQRNKENSNTGFSEDDIVYAERHPLLKGCISSVFENDKCENVSFGKRISDRVDLLNDLWNKDNEKDYSLVKVLISWYDKEKPESKLYLKKNLENWKSLVTDKLKDCFRKNENNTINQNCQGWESMIANTQLIDNSRDDGKIIGVYWDGKIILWATGGCTWNAYGNVILDKMHNNCILSKLLENKTIECIQKIPNCPFFAGWDINFKYFRNNKCFELQWNTDGHVYLIENNERKENFSVESIEEVDVFEKSLKPLIEELSEQ